MTIWHKCSARLLGFVCLGLLLLSGCSTVPKDYADPEGVQYQDAAHEIRIHVVDNFDFSGATALFVAPTKSTAKREEKADEVAQFERILANVHDDFAAAFTKAALLPQITTDASQLPATGPTLELETTVVGYYRGSAAERVLIGFGAGSPYLMVRGRILDRTTGEARLHFLVKRGFEGLDRGIDDESILRGNAKDMAVDVADVLKRVKEHRRLR